MDGSLIAIDKTKGIGTRILQANTKIDFGTDESSSFSLAAIDALTMFSEDVGDCSEVESGAFASLSVV